MTLRKNQANALSGTAGVGAQASEERFSEITSGRSRGQQSLVATGNDSSNEAKKPKERRAQWDWRVSLYEQGRWGNALRRGGNASPGKESSTWAKGLRTLGGFQNFLPGLGLIKPGDTPGKDRGKQL